MLCTVRSHHGMLQCKHKMFYQTSTALFQSAAHSRPLCKKIQTYDVQFRKFIRRIMGPRANGIFYWSKKCTIQYCSSASYLANTPAERWVRKALPRNLQLTMLCTCWALGDIVEMLCLLQTLVGTNLVVFLALAWAKTFDSISPDGLIVALRRFGIPHGFCAIYSQNEGQTLPARGQPFSWAQANGMQDLTRSTSVQSEKHKIL